MYHLSPIILALDFKEIGDARKLLAQCDPSLCRIKIGKHMFTRFGTDWVKEVVGSGYDVFLDLKFHDIPNTVHDACAAAVDLGVWMVNVHALGGENMLAAARKAIETGTTRLIAVTCLTSLNDELLRQLGFAGDYHTVSLRLAKLAYANELDGVVCAANQAEGIKQATNHNFCVVSPGIRLQPHCQGDDQQQVTTPRRALGYGVDYLVVGRGVINTADPIATLKSIHAAVSTPLT